MVISTVQGTTSNENMVSRKNHFLKKGIFTESALKPIQSTFAMSPCLSGCVSTPSGKTYFPVYWRLLVKECITNIGLPFHNKKKKLFLF